MAIKGKNRGKSRSARTVARGPKPVYVPVRRRLLQRRGFWLGLAIVLGVAAVAGIAYGLIQQRNDDREREQQQAMTAAVRQYGGQLDSVLSALGRPVPPSSFAVFADLGSTLDGLESGDVTPEAASATAAADVESAKAAAETIDGIDALAIVRDRGLDEAFILYVLGSKDDLVSALHLYEQAAAIIELAATAADADRPDVIARARGVLRIADEVFGRGYDKYVQAQSLAGTFQPTVPGAVTGPTGVSGFTTVTGPTAATGPTGSP